MDLQERAAVQQHHTVLFGVEGQGGIVRDLTDLKVRVDTVEQKVNTLSTKLVALLFLAGLLGNALGQKLLSVAFAEFLK